MSEYKHGCFITADERIPLCDNNSGNYCADCRSTGLAHCAYPDECDGMRQMRRPEGGCDRGHGRELTPGYSTDVASLLMAELQKYRDLVVSRALLDTMKYGCAKLVKDLPHGTPVPFYAIVMLSDSYSTDVQLLIAATDEILQRRLAQLRAVHPTLIV